MSIKAEKQQSIWEEFKEVFPFLMICTAAFAAGMWIENVRATVVNTPEAYYGLCIKAVLKEDVVVSASDARACGYVAYKLYQEAKSK